MQDRTTDSRGSSLTAAHLEMPDAWLRQGALHVAGYVNFTLALTVTAIWVWPRLGPWVWTHI
jgi:hypothetical protein